MTQVIDADVVLWYRVTEYNAWEGETWYHYFKDGPGGVYDALCMAAENSNKYLTKPEPISLTWDQAEVLTNVEPGYMDIHWFGELTGLEGLKNATEQDLYKGGIRKFGEELFGYDETENED